MAQVKKTLKPSDPEVEKCVNEELKDGELQEVVEIIEEIAENTKTEGVVEQTDIEEKIEETSVIEEFKKGGILKAELGTQVVFPEYIPVVEEEVNEPLDEALYKARMSAIKDIYKDDSHEKAAALARLNSEYGKTKSAESSNKLGLPFYLREITNLANWIQARKTAKDLKTIGYKTADVMGRMTLNAPTEQSFQYNLPVYDLYNKNITKYESQAEQFKTPDMGLNIASRLAILDKSADMRNEQARLTSEAVSQQNQLYDQKKDQYNQIRAEIANKNKQIMTQSALARLNADSAYKQEKRRLDDTLLYKYQDLLNRFGSVDASIKNKTYQYAEQELAARTAGNEALAQQYAKLKEDTQKPGYRSYMLNNILYGKKGTKLRSTTDMLLLNNQKLVAKAIEKLNDNTMRLILKALS